MQMKPPSHSLSLWPVVRCEWRCLGLSPCRIMSWLSRIQSIWGETQSPARPGCNGPITAPCSTGRKATSLHGIDRHKAAALQRGVSFLCPRPPPRPGSHCCGRRPLTCSRRAYATQECGRGERACRGSSVSVKFDCPPASPGNLLRCDVSVFSVSHAARLWFMSLIVLLFLLTTSVSYGAAVGRPCPGSVNLLFSCGWLVLPHRGCWVEPTGPVCLRRHRGGHQVHQAILCRAPGQLTLWWQEDTAHNRGLVRTWAGDSRCLWMCLIQMTL